ncbi:MAG: Uma2 family endonuclease [Lachnospiraceae bacterium]
MALAKKNIYTIQDIFKLPENERAELIAGNMYMHAAPSRMHQKIVSFLHLEIGNYIRKKGGDCEVYPAPFAVFIKQDDKNYVEPDISVICNPEKLDEDGCHGAPDWIIEVVSPGTSSHDYVAKLNLYAEAGVREYWIVDPRTNTITVYFFESELSVPRYTFDDKVKVRIYEDLEVDFTKLKL